jgi:hypothetical protein
VEIGEDKGWVSDERVKDGDEQREEVGEGMYCRPNEEKDGEEEERRPTSTVRPVYISPKLTSKFVNIPGPLCTCCPPPPPKNLANGSFPPPCLRASCCFNPSSPCRSYIFLVSY